jgi:DNA-binding transcriptional LysR family regulator
LVVEQILKQHDLDPTRLRIVAEMGSTEAIKQGIKAGMGVSILSRLALTDELRAGSLCCVPLTGVTLRRHFYIIRHKARTLSPLSQTFVRFLQRIDPISLLPQDTAADAHS